MVLVLRALGLGDLLAGVPALRAVRRALPGHRFVLATPASLSDLVTLTGAVDAVHPTQAPDLSSWAGPPPDVAVNLHGKGPQSHRALAATGPRRLVAFDCPEVGHEGPVWDADEHERSRWCRLVGEVLDVTTDPGDLLLDRPAREPFRRGAVVVHPGAAYRARRWPPERFAEVARWAHRRGHPVVVTGGPSESGLAHEVARLAGLEATAVLADGSGLADLAALVDAARLVVCGDTGVAHVASAFGTPSVVLFGPTPPGRWGPPSEGPHEVVWHGTGVGDPWADHIDPSLLTVSVDEVVSRAQRLLTRVAARAGTTPASG